MIERDNRVILYGERLDPTVVGTISENDGDVEEYTGLVDVDSIKVGESRLELLGQILKPKEWSNLIGIFGRVIISVSILDPSIYLDR